MADYLLNRGGTFYYNRRIPTSILLKFPSTSPVLRISLGTGRKSEAKTLSNKLNIMFDDLAKIYFETPGEYAEALTMFNRFEQATCGTNVSVKRYKEFFEKYGDDAADQIGKVRRVLEVRRNEMLQNPVVHSAVQSPVATPQSPLISSLIDKFIDYQRRKSNWGKGNSSEDKYRNALKYFVELTDKPSNLLTKADIVKVKELLMKVPDTRRYQYYSKLSIKELHTKTIPIEHTISNNTIKQHADRIVTYLNWLFDNDYCSENLSKTLGGIVRTTRKQGKEPYTPDQLKKLFNENYNLIDDTHYWIPLIALHTGARINEICQLDPKDIKQVDGIWVFDIMSSETGDINKRVKRESSKRIIPVHHRILELGFLNYVKCREKKRKLFDVSYTERNGYSGSIGTHWIRYQEKCGVSENVSFHSFRKTVINYFNQTLELPEIAHAYYTGHAAEGNEGIKSYTSKKPLDDAKKMFDRLEYDINYQQIKK